MTRFYGLTGGIGSGKTTAAEIFAGFGVPTLDLDALGKTILENDPAIMDKLALVFGQKIFDQHGIIDRQCLAQIAFSTAANTAKLNSIMHPEIQGAEAQWRRQQTAPIAIIEASVLIESCGTSRMDGVIVIMARENIRIQRALSRGKHSKQQIMAILSRQCSDEDRRHAADVLIDNNASLAELESQVQHFLRNQ